MDVEGIRFETLNGWGVVTLDRQQALNALSRGMVTGLGTTLKRWRDDDRIGGVLVKAVPGRAFCAGGDVVHVAKAAAGGDLDAAMAFFADEYGMNARVGAMPKPYVALIDGICMGGGVGISVHGSHRVMTENALFAVPETGIGLYPDVGATHVLPRLDGRLGRYLGLTGARLDGTGALKAGIGTHFVPSNRLGDLEADLLREGPGGLDAALGRYEGPCPADGTPRGAIDALFDAPDAAGIVANLEADANADNGAFAAETLKALRQKSPLSVAITFAALERGAKRDLNACLADEYSLTARVLMSGEFTEGVRALLIDKDKRPRWRHERIEAVPLEEVAAMLEPWPGAAGFEPGRD